MQDIYQYEASTHLSRKKKDKTLYFIRKKVREGASNMRKKSNIVVQTFINDSTKTQKSRDLNDLDMKRQDKMLMGM
jgi:hypothetical protein